MVSPKDLGYKKSLGKKYLGFKQNFMFKTQNLSSKKKLGLKKVGSKLIWVNFFSFKNEVKFQVQW